jgi:hypothetical protein
MKIRSIVISLFCIGIFAGPASAKDPYKILRGGCVRNVNGKIKAGTVKKEDRGSEIDKCITNSSTYQ